AAAAPWLKVVQAADTDSNVRLEAVSALGGVTDANAPGVGVIDTLLDLVSDKTPAIRAAALRAVAALDSEGFVTVLSGLDPDPNWSVRAALATLLGTLPPDVGLPRL